MSIELTNVIARNEAILFAELDGTVVMMDTDEGRYYELDEVGTRIWTIMESAVSVGAICDALRAEYEVARDTCREDVLAFIAELHRLGMVRIADAGGQAETPAP